jgi:hypothetical protein
MRFDRSIKEQLTKRKMKSDIEIARSVQLRKIKDVAADIDIHE